MTGRPILYSICNWGGADVWTWGAFVGGHMWRITPDIKDSWQSIVNLGFVRQKELHPWSRPNGWNDPGMLVVGMRNRGFVAKAGCNDAEYRSHFALWCMQAAPLIIGCDVCNMDDATKCGCAEPVGMRGEFRCPSQASGIGIHPAEHQFRRWRHWRRAGIVKRMVRIQREDFFLSSVMGCSARQNPVCKSTSYKGLFRKLGSQEASAPRVFAGKNGKTLASRLSGVRACVHPCYLRAA